MYAAWIVGFAMVNGVGAPAYVTLLVAVTALSGVQMVMVGVVGEYVGRIHYEVRWRPHCLVAATDADRPRRTRPTADPATEQDQELVGT
ncbi:Putative glycosyltransferase CsbB [Streptomyces sp. S4.7]|nr:Putative glycosyltransferase CsbB [Streptomyces sp. S4.7]